MMKFIGGMLLIVGTSIGAGMLALPIATSEMGFINSVFLMFGCWLLMSSCAFFMLEVNLWFPPNSNLISMAKKTLGKPGEAIAWVTYLLLLYSLLAAYIAGGSDFLKNVLERVNFDVSSQLVAVVFVAVLGYVVFRGIRSVDLVNRFLMSAKFVVLFFLVVLLTKHLSPIKLSGGQMRYLGTGITVTITSFGFSNIIPSLRNYFKDDVKKLRLAIMIGSLLPLICYIAWNCSVMGVIPREGQDGLINMLHSGRSTSEFINQLSNVMHSPKVTSSGQIFSSICLFTSFLGIALSLADFLSDGLKIEKTTLSKNLLVCSLALVPPLLIVIFYPGIFISALNYAGIYCLVLLALFPVLMAYSGRYYKKISHGYEVMGGKPLLLILIAITSIIILQGLVEIFW